MDLKGKVAIVTGGAQGIGKGIVKRYIEEKAKVAIFDCDEAMMAETKAEMEELSLPHDCRYGECLRSHDVYSPGGTV